MRIIVIQILIVTSLCQSREVLELEIETSRCGWYYVVPIDTIMNSKHHLTPNKDGIYYISKVHYQTLKKINIYNEAGSDILDTVQFLSKVSHDILGDTVKKYELVRFYYPTNKQVSQINWKDPDVYYDYSRKEKIHREKLIKSGKIRFEQKN